MPRQPRFLAPVLSPRCHHRQQPHPTACYQGPARLLFWTIHELPLLLSRASRRTTAPGWGSQVASPDANVPDPLYSRGLLWRPADRYQGEEPSLAKRLRATGYCTVQLHCRACREANLRTIQTSGSACCATSAEQWWL